MQEIITELQEAGISEIHKDAPMSRYTTWQIGGPADLLVVPSGKRELAAALGILHRRQIPWTAIGRGSNMLVADKGIRGVVVKLGEGMDYVRFDDRLAIAGAAYSFIKLSVMAGKRGLTGLEFAGGIPGSVGGAVYMNAGAMGSDVSRILKSAEVLLHTGELVNWNAEQFHFKYRYSLLHDMHGIVTEAVFELQFGERSEINAVMSAHKERRLLTQPLQLPCAGSVFRNPDNQFAARLIEEAGLKGTRVGGVEVSTQHANFIVNTGQGTAEDVRTLMEHIQRVIFEKYGIRLVPEVLEVGER